MKTSPLDLPRLGRRERQFVNLIYAVEQGDHPKQAARRMPPSRLVLPVATPGKLCGQLFHRYLFLLGRPCPVLLGFSCGLPQPTSTPETKFSAAPHGQNQKRRDRRTDGEGTKVRGLRALVGGSASLENTGKLVHQKCIEGLQLQQQ